MGHDHDHASKDRFGDSRAVLELRDSVSIANIEFVISTLMLDKVKVLHSQRYWFETYLFELSNGQPLAGKIIGQYTNAHDAIQGHKAIVSGIIPAIMKTRDITEELVKKMISDAKAGAPDNEGESEPESPLSEETSPDISSSSIEAEPPEIPGKNKANRKKKPEN